MPDFAGLMKQAQQLQTRMAELQKEMEEAEVEGASGGGLVVVRMNAKGGARSVKIDPSLLKPEEGEILEDLIVAALADAKGKAEAFAAEKMQALTGGLPLPPGFKLPF